MPAAPPTSTTSLWAATAPVAPPRPPLPGNTQVDVAIVGAGFTGLWTAYELLRREPGCRVLVVEAERVGHGASGRNGGWCSALLPMSLTTLARQHGKPAAVTMQRAMIATVDEVAGTLASEGIDGHVAKGGYLHLARSPLQMQRLHDDVEEMRSFGFDDGDLAVMSAGEAAERVGATGIVGATFTPHCAALHPARVVRGLADAVERRGGVIHEATPVLAIAPGRVETERGTVQAEMVVRATEGYTSSLAGHRRELVPIYSLMIATAPLPQAFWDDVGWRRRETVNDARHLIVYAQRTADDRVAFGGRGAPYHWGSRRHDRFERNQRVHDALTRELAAMFPSLRGVEITHRWGGPLGVPRDWYASVGFERRSGLAWAGGYVGDGVAASNLAGRTLADLLTGRASELTRLPWVGHQSPRWEPEPIRFAAINAAVQMTASLDRTEQRRGKAGRARAWLLDRLTG